MRNTFLLTHTCYDFHLGAYHIVAGALLRIQSLIPSLPDSLLHVIPFLFFGPDMSFTANDYIRHNVDKLSRVYPAGSRTDSSNYNPVPLWNAGCQIGTDYWHMKADMYSQV